MGLSTDRDRAWPEFQRLWAALLETARHPRTLVVVEGERDRRSLARLRLTTGVRVLHQGQTFGEFAQQLSSSGDRVIVLTDWDAKGGRLARHLVEHLEGGPLVLDLEVRRRLGITLRGELVHVEGLAGWARRTAERLNVPFEAWLDEVEADGRGPGRPTG